MLMVKRSHNIYSLILLLGLIVLTGAICTGQDSILVSGKITGDNNLPLEGVSVSIQGIYQIPFITEEDGQFNIYVPSGDVWLIINPTEKYKSKRVFLNNRDALTIQLTPEDISSGYDEVIMPVKTELSRNIISSFNTPDPEKALQKPYQTIDQFFQGIIPGMLITGHSGMPGSGTTSFLNGFKSMYTNNQPLYIIDGLPLETPGHFPSKIDGFSINPLTSLDPLDITSITILKDYLGSALYGMRASNGIILIETLKPTEVQTSIDFSYRTGISLRPEQIPQLNDKQYKTLANEILISSGQPEEYFKENYPELFATTYDEEYYKYMNNTNWQDKVFSNALMNEVYVRVRGGDEIARYGLSVSYLNHEGIITNTGYNRFNVRFVGTFNIFQWLRMYVSSNLNTNSSELKESARARETSPILNSLFKSPLLNPYQFDENGRQLKTLEEVGSLGFSNPLAIIQKFEARNKNYRFLTSVRVEGDIARNLKWNTYIGLNLNSLNESVFMPNTGMDLYYDKEVYNASKSLKNHLYSFYNNNFVSFKKELNNKHMLGTSAGLRIQTNRFQTDWGVAKNSHERDEYKQLQDGTSYLREMGGENAKWNRLAAYGTADYDFRDKYFINATLVIENSTRIGNDADGVIHIGEQPFGLFYSVGAAWRLSGERFLKNIFWLEDLKLRLNYGLVGNDDIGNYSALDYYAVDHYRETTGMIPGSFSDQSLKFETNTQFNAGMDINLFGNRLDFSFDLFNNRTRDLLVFIPQQTYIGFSILPGNQGEILNKGMELSLFSRILNIGKFKWDIGFNFSKVKNSVEDIQAGQIITTFEGGEFISRIGEPVLSFYGYSYKGVFSSTEEVLEVNLKTEKGIAFGAGDAIFEDISGPNGEPDGIIDDFDKTIIGSPIPDFYGGFNSCLRYGRWSIDVYLQFVEGNELFNYLRYQNERTVDLANQSTNVLKRWFTEGQITDVPRAVCDDPAGNSAFSSRWIEDGSYVRLKNLTLAYTIPDKFLFFRNLQVFITATNLVTWTRYLGYDPEFSYSYFNMEQGIDYGLMPFTRKFLAGIRLGL
jgi:TonB-linked SusC/RagA family outer membrane protein